ncbi:MAG: hypothetical protein JSR82_24420 [Verrucomicrobia bacterium]|nr:hypothetical protein [Verrucomicrobiota bacterium]
MTRTLASFGVDFDANPGIDSSRRFGEAMRKTGEDAKTFAGAVRDANREASDSAREHASAVETAGTVTGNVWRRMRQAASNALSETIDQLQRISAALGGNFARAFDDGYAKVAALVAEIALLANGMGILSIPIFAAGSAFGSTGTIVASVATLFFLFSERTTAARIALKAYLEQLGLTNVGLRVFQATAGAANTAAAAVGINLTSSLVRTIALVGSLVLGYQALKLAIDSVNEGAKREVETLKYGVASRNLRDPGSRMQPVIDTALTLPGDSTSDILKGAAKLERAGLDATRENLERISAAALVAGKDFSEVADKVADLYEELQNGDDAESTIRSLQKMGLVSDEARDKIAELQKAGKEGDEVWNVAAKALDRYGLVLDQRRQTFPGAKDELGKAWDELKATLGGAVSDLLTPVLQGASSAMRQAVGVARELKSTIRELLDEIALLPENLVMFFTKGDLIKSQKAERLGGTKDSRQDLPETNPLPENKSRGGGGRQQTYETDASLVERYRKEIEFLSKAMDDGTVSAGEFATRQAQLRDRLAQGLGDPSRYAGDIEQFRAAQQEKLRILEVMKQDIERGNASLLQTITYGLEKALQESGKIAKQMANAIPQLITGTADAFGSAFASIVTGSKSAGAAFRDFAAGVLNDIARVIGRLLFLQAIESTLGFFGIGPKSLTSGGGFSLGGSSSVLGGDWSGLGVPIGKAAPAPLPIGKGAAGDGVSIGTIAVSVQSDGSAQVQTDATGAKARGLASAIRSAVVAEIQNQLRPGNLLAPTTRAVA